jgi:long-subunit acyl-CoA synthetase (AMP-forming)
MPAPRLLLDHVYEHETQWRDRVYLTQPLPGGATIDHTWGQALDEARRMATHLRGLGLGHGDRIALLSRNCAHSVIAELAIWMAGCTTVSLYPNEHPDTLRFELAHSAARLLFVGPLEAWANQSPAVPASLPRIALPGAAAGAGEPWETIVAARQPLAGQPARASDDIAMLIYTSGSTGEPKGVLHDFGHVSAAVASIVATIGYGPADRMLSYLPLAHVFERAFIECASLMAGGRLFFVESPATFMNDLRRARPTLFLSVPRLWARFRQGVFERMPSRRLDRLLAVPLLGRVVARRVLAGLGLDRVRIAGSGSAPIAPELIAWYRRLGLNLLEGYGMTEDFACSHMSRPGASRPGSVGLPFPGVEVRIAGDGEVLVRSPGRFVGYLGRPDLDAASFTPDGHFRTGDRGEIDEDGLLRLTGRIKEPFKTAGGKYVAPAPIESRLERHPMVAMSLVTGAGRAQPCALIVLADSPGAGARDPAARARIGRELAGLLDEINASLPVHERLRMIVVMPEPWSVGNGLLTPTLKTRRARIEEAVAGRLSDWYGQTGPVVWA